MSAWSQLKCVAAERIKHTQGVGLFNLISIFSSLAALAEEELHLYIEKSSIEKAEIHPQPFFLLTVRLFCPFSFSFFSQILHVFNCLWENTWLWSRFRCEWAVTSGCVFSSSSSSECCSSCDKQRYSSSGERLCENSIKLWRSETFDKSSTAVGSSKSKLK